MRAIYTLVYVLFTSDFLSDFGRSIVKLTLKRRPKSKILVDFFNNCPWFRKSWNLSKKYLFSILVTRLTTPRLRVRASKQHFMQFILFFFFEKKRKGKERKKFKSIHKSLKTRGLYSCHQAVIWPTSVLVKFQSGPEAPTKSPPVYQVLRYPWRAFKSL